jgi:hypothetical protein
MQTVDCERRQRLGRRVRVSGDVAHPPSAPGGGARVSPWPASAYVDSSPRPALGLIVRQASKTVAQSRARFVAFLAIWLGPPSPKNRRLLTASREEAGCVTRLDAPGAPVASGWRVWQAVRDVAAQATSLRAGVAMLRKFCLSRRVFASGGCVVGWNAGELGRKGANGFTALCVAALRRARAPCGDASARTVFSARCAKHWRP